MSYQLLYSNHAIKQLKKLDKIQSRVIVTWLTKNIKNCDNPRSLGKPLRADRKGEWRYRIGSYRVIVKIDDEELVVLAVEIGHRREVYK